MEISVSIQKKTSPMSLMATRIFFIGGVSLLLSQSALASSSDRTSSIFSKRNRVLAPPSKDIRSNAEDLDKRLESESDRLDRAPTDDEQNQIPSATSPVKPMPPVVPPQSASATVPVYRGEEATTKARVGSSRRDRFFSRSSTDQKGSGGDRIFAMGFVGAGAYGVFGGELEFALDDRTSLSLGLGTGMTYSTWGVNGRYYFNQSGRLHTFFQAGYANWYMGKTPSSASAVKPQYLAQRFFFDGGAIPARQRVDLMYPGLGVLAQHKSGLAFSGQLQYLIALHDFSGGLFGSFGVYFYF